VKRRSALFALPALPALALTPGAWAAAAPAAPGQPVNWPSSVPLLDGSTWMPTPGQAAIVVMWSTTCPFCKRHNMHVQKLHQALAGRPARVLGVARDRSAAAVQRSMVQNGWTFPVTLAWHDMAAALTRRNMIPLTVTVDRLGRLQQVIPGEMFEEDVLQLATLAA